MGFCCFFFWKEAWDGRRCLGNLRSGGMSSPSTTGRRWGFGGKGVEPGNIGESPVPPNPMANLLGDEVIGSSFSRGPTCFQGVWGIMVWTWTGFFCVFSALCARRCCLISLSERLQLLKFPFLVFIQGNLALLPCRMRCSELSAPHQPSLQEQLRIQGDGGNVSEHVEKSPGAPG